MTAILDGFLRRQLEEGMALDAQSDLLTLLPVDGPPPQHYLVRLFCRGLVRTPAGQIVEAERFDIGIRFADDYLRAVNPFEVLSWFGPRNVWHPNISQQLPLLCIGPVMPGTPLVELIFRAWETITYVKCTMTERNALNPEACVWARQNQHRFPVDRRPLKRRPLELQVIPDGGAR